MSHRSAEELGRISEYLSIMPPRTLARWMHTAEVVRVATTRRGAFMLHAFDGQLSDYGLKSRYSNVDKLPEWFKDKLMRLSMLTVPPPLTPRVEGIGQRMDENTYWVEVTGSKLP